MDATQARSPIPIRLLGLEPRDVVLLPRDAAREVDRLATAEFGIPSIILMENAAMHLAAVVERVMHARGASGAVIIAGSGNNGGDGFAAARHLANAGVPVRIIMPLGLPRSGGDAAINLEITRRMGLPLEISNSADTLKDTLADIEPRDVIVDALFGTGLDRPLTDRTAEIVIRINERREAGSPVVAADIPSGLDGDTGEVLGTAVMADVTVTFAGVKPGLLRCAGQVGELWLAGIGVPSSLLHRLGSPASGVRVSSGMPG